MAGRNAIVTGATSGIGEAIACRLAGEGATVAVVGRRAEKGARVVRGIREAGGRAFYAHADVSDSRSVDSMLQECLRGFDGDVSILVNNAGVSSKNTKVEDLAELDWDLMMDTNAKGTYLCSKAVLPSMARGRGGAIVNISSAGGLRGYAGGAAYASSKAAIIMLTKVLALEHGRDKVRTNCICPGSVHSDMFDGCVRHFVESAAGRPGAPSADQIVEGIARGIPVGRIGEPGDIADLAVFLSSDESSFINGAVIVVDGGQTL